MRLNVPGEDAEDVGGRPADVDADRVDPFLLGDHLQNVAHGAGRRHDGCVRPANQLVVAGGVGHHVFEKDIVNAVARGPQVFALEHWSQVGDYEELDAIAQRVADEFARVLIAGVDQRHLVIRAEPRPRSGRGNPFGDFDHFGRVATVGAAREQNHVGPQLADALNLLVGEPLVVGGDHVHDDGPGPERGPLGAGRGHFANDAGDHHLQAAAGARCRDVDVAALVAAGRTDQLSLLVHQPPAGQLAHLGRRIDHADSHVGDRLLDGGGGFAAVRLAVAVAHLLDEDGFGGGATAVGREDDVDFVEIHRLASFARRSGGRIVLDGRRLGERGRRASVGLRGQVLESPAQIVDRAGLFEELREPVVVVTCQRKRGDGVKEIQDLRRNPVERSRHFQKSDRGGLHPPPSQNSTKPLDHLPFLDGRFEGARGIERKGVSKPVHFVRR